MRRGKGGVWWRVIEHRVLVNGAAREEPRFYPAPGPARPRPFVGGWWGPDPPPRGLREGRVARFASLSRRDSSLWPGWHVTLFLE